MLLGTGPCMRLVASGMNIDCGSIINWIPEQVTMKLVQPCLQTRSELTPCNIRGPVVLQCPSQAALPLGWGRPSGGVAGPPGYRWQSGRALGPGLCTMLMSPAYKGQFTDNYRDGRRSLDNRRHCDSRASDFGTNSLPLFETSTDLKAMSARGSWGDPPSRTVNGGIGVKPSIEPYQDIIWLASGWTPPDVGWDRTITSCSLAGT
ncbi:hypothetical protein NDU88_007651 [Pleurodeles waltl]|uniref:Uncharacterized protein n=1 Tax=Pleurodeles waltl TaxID=8319 RepID=A0AAV7U1A5_PLEWA|nr:hypothetical protein NDU88_007651 [Pleurodeles waltl]